MADNTILNTGVGGDTIRDINRSGVKTQVNILDIGGEAGPESLVTTANPMPTGTYDASANGINSLSAEAGHNGLLVAAGATDFINSTVNTTTAQLASGASFVGTIESIFNQQTASIDFFSDQASLVTVQQFIDLGGTRPLPPITFTVPAGAGLNRALTVNGNYLNVVVTNTGPSTTTALNCNIAYGVLPATTNLGNMPASINEVNGTAIIGSSVPVSVTNTAAVPVADAILEQAQDPTTPLNITLVSDPYGDFPGINIFDQLVQNGGLALNTQVVNPEQRDVNQAMILSDAPIAVMSPYMPIGAVFYIDTQGYQSLNITTEAFTGNVTGTNDKKTFSAVTGCPVVLGALASAVTANASFWFPCPTRYLALTATAAGTFTYFLRATPWNGAYTTSVPTGTASNNVAQFGGTAVVNAGVAGIPSVGGNIAAGTAPTVNPVPVGGIDTSGLTRRVLMDTAGRVQVDGFGVDNTSTQRQLGVIAPTAGLVALPAVVTQDMSNFEGQTSVELLGQILQELRITNFYLFTLQTGQNATPDDPMTMRSNPDMFN